MKYFDRLGVQEKMKKGLRVSFWISVVTITVSILMISATSATTVSIGSVTAGEGETAVVPLMIESVTNLGGASVNLTYNASIVNVTGVSNSDFDSVPNLNTRGPGWVLLQGGQYETGLNDDVKLCDVTLQAIGNKGDTSPLNLNEVILEDMAMQSITVDNIVNGTFTIQQDTEKPIVINPNAYPQIIPEDTDNEPLWAELSNLSIVVTDESNIVSVTLNLSSIGGSAVQPMARIGLSNVWNVSANASVGTAIFEGGSYVPHLLQVNATDEYSNSNTSVSIELTVMENGDVQPYDGDDEVDFTHDALYLVRHTKGMPGYEELH